MCGVLFVVRGSAGLGELLGGSCGLVHGMPVLAVQQQVIHELRCVGAVVSALWKDQQTASPRIESSGA